MVGGGAVPNIYSQAPCQVKGENVALFGVPWSLQVDIVATFIAHVSLLCIICSKCVFMLEPGIVPDYGLDDGVI
jgi:hypothetical protein